jgi:hypothetical protein
MAKKNKSKADYLLFAWMILPCGPGVSVTGIFRRMHSVLENLTQEAQQNPILHL